MLKRMVILTRFPVLSAILPPMSCDMPDASELTACTYPMSRSLAPDEVTLNPTKGLATLFANEFQKVCSLKRSPFQSRRRLGFFCSVSGSSVKGECYRSSKRGRFSPLTGSYGFFSDESMIWTLDGTLEGSQWIRTRIGSRG